MLRISSRVLILCLIISLGVGTGIGYATRSGHVRSLNSEITQKEDQISTLTSGITGVRAEIASLASDLQKKQADYDALLAEQDRISKELETLQKIYDTLLGEVDKVTLDQVRKLTEQVSLLAADNNKLSSQISQIQVENAALKGSLDATTQINVTLNGTISILAQNNDWLTKRVDQLVKQVTPAPDHALAPSQVWGVFKSDPQWLDRDLDLQRKVEEIGQSYYKTHLYKLGEFDCNDMAVDLWNMLLKENIKSVIVVGNLNIINETLAESDHAWLDIFDSKGRVFYLEPTTGEVLYGQMPDGSRNSRVVPYREGLIYEKPSDMRKDLKNLWA